MRPFRRFVQILTIQFYLVFVGASCSSVSKPLSTVGGQKLGKAHTTATGLLPDIGRLAPKIVRWIIPPGNLNRRVPTEMKPTYITIHSTDNQSPGADADAHARLLHRAGRGILSWHFTVDEDSIIQTLPTTEQARHADYDGPGNRNSIAIEMCENEGNSREKTMAQTARLTAYLMRKHNIPISRVVPHQHWRRVRGDGKDFGHKNCPHFLMEQNGTPGEKWASFLDRIKKCR